jgi:hypothetical protein
MRVRPPLFSLALLTSMSLFVTACGGGSEGTSASTTFNHIFYIMMENHGVDEIVGNTADAPYINQLAGEYATASSYFGVTHPSLPNYLAAISGDFQGIWDDCKAGDSCAPEEFVPDSGDSTSSLMLTPDQITSSTSKVHMFSGDTIVDQLESVSFSWKAYMQGIPGVGATDEYAPVDNGTPRKLYAQKHNPFMYFSKVRNDNARMQKIVPLTQLDQDLASASSTPRFVWISPDQCNDMHGVSTANATALNNPNCATPASGLDHSVIQLGDTFLKNQVNKIMASPAWNENSAIVIVWDEDDYSDSAGCCGSPTGVGGATLGGSKVPAIVIRSKNATHKTSADPFNHYSLLATIEAMWDLPCLGNACTVPAKMTTLFAP